MITNFREELKKRDNIQCLFDFCEEIDSMCPDAVCRSTYLARYGNVAIVKFWPQDEAYPGLGKRANKFNIQSQDPYTQKVVTLTSCIDINKEFAFLYSDKNTIMRDAQGRIFQIENCRDYPPKVISAELSPEVRKVFERAYNTYYTDNLPRLEPNASDEEFAKVLVDAIGKAIKDGEREKLKRKLKRIEASDTLPEEEER